MKQPINFVWMTPTYKEGQKRDCVALFRFGEWIEIYNGEALMCHPSYIGELKSNYMVECDGPTVYPTIEEALNARNNISGVKHTH
jgi:hypothetical protein